MKEDCDPTYGQVDDLLEVITKSKSLHILLILDRKNKPIRFTDIKKHVNASSTTVSRRLKELEAHNLIIQVQQDRVNGSKFYTLSDDARGLSSIMQSLFDWVANKNQ